MKTLRITPGAMLTIHPLIGKSQSFKVVPCQLNSETLVLSADDITTLEVATYDGLILGKAKPEVDDISLSLELDDALSTNFPNAVISGALKARGEAADLINKILVSALALMAMAFFIALIGVSNALSLSVIERRRESALLRALGLQATGLRMMLLIEALILAAAAIIASLLIGIPLGWCASTLIMRELTFQDWVFPHLDWMLIGGSVATTLIAAVFASILPSKRAAAAMPVEALADQG